MIDIHAHILPGIDDGPSTLDEAVAMVRMAAENGTTALVATPHHDYRFTFDPVLVDEKIEELRSAVGPFPAIHAGCELHFTADAIDDALKSPLKFTIGHGTYLLLEFSNSSIPKTTTAILALLLREGITPVIAHPERNPLLREIEDSLAEWGAMGCPIQITAGSIFGWFGTAAQRAAYRLLGRGLVHAVASDAHDLRVRPPVLNRAGQRIADRFGPARADALFVRHPNAVVTGRALPASVREEHSLWRRICERFAGRPQDRIFPVSERRRPELRSGATWHESGP